MERIEDLFGRLRDKAAAKGLVKPEGQGSQPRLSPERHPVRDFFIADILDWALKDDRHSMEHPFFSLSKKPDRRVRHYEHNGISIIIKPGADGMATIWDKDVLLYAVSQLVEAMNQGRPLSRTVRLTAHNFLVTTNRTTGGRSYDEMKAALQRLHGTLINTTIVTNGIRQTHGFGLIDNWTIAERAPSGRMLAITVTLNEWLFNAIVAGEVLTLNRDYFRLSGGLERRLYEIGRKHCGRQARWAVSMPVLYAKSGSGAVLAKFRAMAKRTIATDPLPDYRLAYDSEADRVTFEARHATS